jgi:hypothetical protein
MARILMAAARPIATLTATAGAKLDDSILPLTAQREEG